MKQVYVLDGSKISNEATFHALIANLLNFPPYNGCNMDLLWDCLTGWIDTDIKLVWRNHEACKISMGDDYWIAIRILERMHEYHPEFEFELE